MPPQKRPPHLRPRPPSLFASRTSSGRPPNGAPTPQGYPLTAWSALLLPTTSPAAAIACTANDHGQKTNGPLQSGNDLVPCLRLHDRKRRRRQNGTLRGYGLPGREGIHQLVIQEEREKAARRRDRTPAGGSPLPDRKQHCPLPPSG